MTFTYEMEKSFLGDWSLMQRMQEQSERGGRKRKQDCKAVSPPNLDRGPPQVLPAEATEPIHFAVVELRFIQTDVFLCNDAFIMLLSLLPSRKPFLKRKPHLRLGGKMARRASSRPRLRQAPDGTSSEAHLCVHLPAKSSLSNNPAKPDT